MSAVEQEIINRIQELNEEQQRRVLDYVRQVESAVQVPKLSARDLMKLPPDERRRIVSASLALAAEEDFEIFEAYSEEGFDEPD